MIQILADLLCDRGIGQWGNTSSFAKVVHGELAAVHFDPEFIESLNENQINLLADAVTECYRDVESKPTEFLEQFRTPSFDSYSRQP